MPIIFSAVATLALAIQAGQQPTQRRVVTAEVLRQVAILSAPFMPSSAGKLLDLLGVPKAQRQFSELGGGHRIAVGTALPAPSPVFPRYVETEASAQS